jgi:hypothetical protein
MLHNVKITRPLIAKKIRPALVHSLLQVNCLWIQTQIQLAPYYAFLSIRQMALVISGADLFELGCSFLIPELFIYSIWDINHSDYNIII